MLGGGIATGKMLGVVNCLRIGSPGGSGGRIVVFVLQGVENGIAEGGCMYIF